MKKKSNGFTLVELLVVIAILGVLASIAYPSYLNHINKSRRAEGMAELVIVAASQERFYTANSRYANSVTAQGPPVDFGLGLTGVSETGLYNITVTNNTPITSFTLTATPQGWVDNQCGNFILTNTGIRRVTGDFDGDTFFGDPDDIAACWG